MTTCCLATPIIQARHRPTAVPRMVDGGTNRHHNAGIRIMLRSNAIHRRSEEELVTELRATRDGRLFDELYRRSRRKVFGVCFNILGEASAAEDACHDAYVRAWERIDSLRGSNFTAWVRRIAANRCYDELRRTRPDELDGHHPEPVADDQIEGAVIARQELNRAIDVIASLDEHQRRVFLLRHLDSRSYDEISEATGYDAKQVKSYLQNARRNFHLAWRQASGGISHG